MKKYFDNAFFAVVLMAVMPAVWSSESITPDIPKWLFELVSTISDKHDDSVRISQYRYREQVVYVLDRTKACCDLGATMYDDAGNAICRLIGIAGSWEDRCSDFPENGRESFILNRSDDSEPNKLPGQAPEAAAPIHVSIVSGLCRCM